MSCLSAYTDSYLDAESALHYMNARYYDPELKRFTSVDAWSGDMSRPQTLNKYSYVINNPLGYNDPSGNKLRAVNRPVKQTINIGNYSRDIVIGAHAFVEITDNPNINNGQRTTLGGYTDNFITGELFKGENYHTDYDLAESDFLATHEIPAPAGYTQQEYEQSVYDSYQNLPDTFGKYSAFGNPYVSGQSNSGNVFTEILVGAGMTTDQVSNYESNYYDAGVGRQTANNTPSLYQQLKDKVSDLLD